MIAESWTRLHPRRRAPWPGFGTDSDDGRQGRGLFDPETRRFRVLDPHDDDALPGLPSALARGELVSWRPGQRAVVRVIDGQARRYLKVLPPARARSRVTLLRSLSSEPAARELVAPLLYDDLERGHLLFEEAPGAPLKSRLARGEARGLGAAGGLLARFHALSGTIAGAAMLDADDLVGWAERASAWFPEHGAAIAQALGALTSEAPRVATEHVLLHGDPHGGNVMCGSSRAKLIDFDGAGLGPAARDLGNAIAWLELRALTWSRPRSELAAWRARLLAGYAQWATPPLAACVDGERRAALFRMACSHLFRARTRRWAPILLQRCLHDR